MSYCFHHPDILVTAETWLSPSILSAETFPHHYNVTRKNRTDGYGEVLVAYRNTLACYELNYDSSAELVASRFALNNQTLIVCQYTDHQIETLNIWKTTTKHLPN